MEGIFLHVLADTLGSVGVVMSTLLIQYKGWLIADPACSIFISILIVSSVIPLLRNSAEILLQRVPRGHEHELKSAVSSIMKINGVCGIQNFHIWTLANHDVVGTLHLYISADTDQITAKEKVSDILRDAGVRYLNFENEHSTNMTDYTLSGSFRPASVLNDTCLSFWLYDRDLLVILCPFSWKYQEGYMIMNVWNGYRKAKDDDFLVGCVKKQTDRYTYLLMILVVAGGVGCRS
ncbi:zinc transporter 5 [Tanacetum coccineum]